MSTKSRTGFDKQVYPITDPSITSVLRYMLDLTIIMDEFCSGASHSSPSLLRFDQMMFVQHSLVSLPSRQQLVPSPMDPPDLDVVISVYETTRLALRCYAYLVTFPSPDRIFPRRHLTQVLHSEIRGLISFSQDKAHLKLAFWATVLGAVVAYGTTDTRLSYIDLVSELAYKLQLQNWAQAKELVSSYLWHGPTNDVDALNLWIEVQERFTK